MVTPIGTVVTAKTGVKKWSTGQGVFLPLVKRSRTIFVTWYCSQAVKSLFADVDFGTVKRSRAFLQCGQEVKQQKNDSQIFLDPGLSRDYSAYGSAHPLHTLNPGSALLKLMVYT